MKEVDYSSRATDSNEFKFCGTIVNIYQGSKTTIMTLGISTFGKYKRRNNYPHICFFDEEVRKAATVFNIHDKVLITGYVSTSKKEDVRAENRPPQTFVAEQILPAKSIMDKNMNIATAGSDPVLAPDENAIRVIGTVDKAFTGRGGNVNLIISSFHDDKYLKLIKVAVFPEKNENPMEYMRPGTRVCVDAMCRTSKREGHNGEIKYFENIVASNITVL